MTNLVPIGRALISVSDKTGLLELARALGGYGVELISTGGTNTVWALATEARERTAAARA